MRITIQKFQELYYIAQYDIDEVDKSIMLVKCLTGKTDLEIENMPIKKYNMLCRKIQDSFEAMNKKMLNGKPRNLIKANGRRYWLNYDIARPPMSAGRYVEVATFSSDIIGNLHKIMATMATPVKFVGIGWRPIKDYDYSQHDIIANDMLQMDFKHAYHASVFFWAVFSKSILSSKNYFLSLTTKKEEVEELLTTLQRLSDGYTQASWYRNLKISV